MGLLIEMMLIINFIMEIMYKEEFKVRIIKHIKRFIDNKENSYKAYQVYKLEMVLMII